MSVVYTGEATITTTGNIDDLDFSNRPVIRMNNATLATIRGLKAGIAGQQVQIVSVGAGQVDLSHQDTGDGTAANRLINFAAVGKTSLAAGVGAATYQYDATTARWRLVSHEQGAWIDIAYASGNFTANGSMTWTVDSGDQVVYAYFLVGCSLALSFTINGTTVGGTPSDELHIALPAGLLCLNGEVVNTIRAYDNGTDTIGFAGAVTNAGYIRCWRNGFTNWAAATNNTSVQGKANIAVK